MSPSFNAPVLATATAGVLSDFLIRTLAQLPSVQYIILNLHPTDTTALAAALGNATSPGVGKAVNYYVKPAQDGAIALSMGKPSATEVRSGWMPEPVAVRFRHRDVCRVHSPVGGGLSAHNLPAPPALAYPENVRTPCPPPQPPPLGILPSSLAHPCPGQ